MKPLIIIVFTVAGSIALAAASLAGARISFNPIEPLSAVLIGGVSGAFGATPLLRTGRHDLVAVVQLALVGTVLHLLTQIALIAVFLFTHTLAPRGSSLAWLVAEYWISITALVWQLRKLILERVPAAKAGY